MNRSIILSPLAFHLLMLITFLSGFACPAEQFKIKSYTKFHAFSTDTDKNNISNVNRVVQEDFVQTYNSAIMSLAKENDLLINERNELLK